MDKKIKSGVYEIYFDEKRGRVFTIGSQSVRVYDTKTMERIAVLRHPNPTCVYVDQTSGIVAIMSTTTEFAFYSADDYTPLGSFAFTGKRNWSSSDEFYYDEKETMLYGLANKNLVEHIYCVSPKTLTYRLIPLTPAKKENLPEHEMPYTRHKFLRYENGSFYMIRNFYNISDVGERVYEALYGKFEEENGTLVLKEKLYSTKERCLERLDLELTEEELALARPLFEPSKVRENGGFYRSYRNERQRFGRIL